MRTDPPIAMIVEHAILFHRPVSLYHDMLTMCKCVYVCVFERKKWERLAKQVEKG